ncbi:PKD domain-containing protein [Actinoplanes sp. NPDC048967]|uniref:PKD domain-containing protein n=1 Tax=Actinoplanes sp. NPDC048967 TaxID=3155269 RepID=UPI0033DDD704
MNSRLTRPLLAFAISGALVAGSSLVGGPASAEPAAPQPGSTDAASVQEEPTPDATDPAVPAPDPTDTEEPTPDPTDTTDPGPEPDPADTAAPVGKFALNSRALWIGQSVSLTQGAVTDDTTPAEQVTRTATWGDGTSTTLAADTAQYTHEYTANGKFTVTVTYQDAAGNSSKATSTVTITTPGKFKFSKTTVWAHEPFSVTFSNVPNGTTKIVFDQGDGWVVTLKGKNQSAWLYYYTRKNGSYIKGSVTSRATFYNKYGASSAIVVGKVTVKADGWKPTTTVKKPKNSNRIKSWKYATGTAKDKGSGVYRVAVFASRQTGSKFYCYSSNNTWKLVKTDAQAEKYCVAHYVKAKKGKWSLRLKGVAKGTLWVDASTQDVSSNWGKFATVKAKITRS